MYREYYVQAWPDCQRLQTYLDRLQENCIKTLWQVKTLELTYEIMFSTIFHSHRVKYDESHFRPQVVAIKIIDHQVLLIGPYLYFVELGNYYRPRNMNKVLKHELHKLNI